MKIKSIERNLKLFTHSLEAPTSNQVFQAAKLNMSAMVIERSQST